MPKSLTLNNFSLLTNQHNRPGALAGANSLLHHAGDGSQSIPARVVNTGGTHLGRQRWPIALDVRAADRRRHRGDH